MIVPSTLAADFAQLAAEAGELKVPLSVHEEMVHARELRGEAAHDREHV